MTDILCDLTSLHVLICHEHDNAELSGYQWVNYRKSTKVLFDYTAPLRQETGLAGGRAAEIELLLLQLKGLLVGV